jgi:hypothetical protein
MEDAWLALAEEQDWLMVRYHQTIRKFHLPEVEISLRTIRPDVAR